MCTEIYLPKGCIKMLEKIDILEVVKVLIKKWWIMFICVVLFGGATYGYSKYVQPKVYASTGRMYIDTYLRNVAGSEVDAQPDIVQRDVQGINASQRSVLTCIEVLKSNTVLKQVSKNTGYGYSASAIRNMVTMKSANETEVLEVRVRCGNQEHAKGIADELMKVGETELKEIVGVSTAKIIDEGTASNSPISPNIALQTVVGALVGFLISAALIVFGVIMDNRVKSEDDLKKYKVPVIGVIPEM